MLMPLSLTDDDKTTVPKRKKIRRRNERERERETFWVWEKPNNGNPDQNEERYHHARSVVGGVGGRENDNPRNRKYNNRLRL